jgi:hypothetical protein
MSKLIAARSALKEEARSLALKRASQEARLAKLQAVACIRNGFFLLLDPDPVLNVILYGIWSPYFQCCGSGSGIRCLSLTPGSGMGKKSRYGSGMNIPKLQAVACIRNGFFFFDPGPVSNVSLYGIRIPYFQCTASGIWCFSLTPGSGIRDG